jgi:hypothetical protein
MNYVCLYSGPDHSTAQLIVRTQNPAVILAVAEAVLDALPRTKDPVLRELTEGRRGALREVIRKARGGQK